jgi:WD40 repeat protein
MPFSLGPCRGAFVMLSLTFALPVAVTASPAPSPAVATAQPRWKQSPSNGKYFINSVAVSDDAGRVVGGTFFHYYPQGKSRRVINPGGVHTPPTEMGVYGIYCYSAAGAQLWKDEFIGWQGVYWVAISGDGSGAMAGGQLSKDAGFVRAYDGNTGQRLLDYPTKTRVNQVAMSRDGEWGISAAETLILFRRVTAGAMTLYHKTAEYTPGAANGGGIVCASISADGRTIAYAGFDGEIGVLAHDGAGNLTRRAHWKVPGDQGSDFCHMISLSPDGQGFAAGGALGLFYYFDVASFVQTQQPTITYDSKTAGSVYGVALAEDRSFIAGVVNDGDAGAALLTPVDPKQATPLQRYALLRNPNSAAINAAHNLFAIADGHPDGTPGHFYCYDLNGGPTRPPRWTYQAGNMSWPIAIAAHGGAVVAGSDDGYIYYFKP